MTPTADTLVPDDLWQAIQPLLPTPPRRYGCRARIDDRAPAWPASSTSSAPASPGGCCPPASSGCGSPVTCWRRLRDWQRAGVWQRLHQVLLDALGGDGRLDWSRAVFRLDRPCDEGYQRFVSARAQILNQQPDLVDC
jgi:transposase